MIQWIARLRPRRNRPATPGQQAATNALDRALCDKREAEERLPEVAATARRLREHQQRNHFAERFRTAIEGGPR